MQKKKKVNISKSDKFTISMQKMTSKSLVDVKKISVSHSTQVSPLKNQFTVTELK